MRLSHFCWLFLAACWPTAVVAHPITDDNHHRTISVRLPTRSKPQKVVRVDYRLELEERIAVIEAFAALKDDKEWTHAPDRRTAMFRTWGKLLGPRLADNLTLMIDGERVPLRFASMQPRFTDDDGKDLQHLRCDFAFTAVTTLDDRSVHEIRLHEGNDETDGPWPNDRGKLRMEVTASTTLQIVAIDEPDESLLALPAEKLTDKQYAALHDLSARFRLYVIDSDGDTSTNDKTGDAPADESPNRAKTLVDLLLNSQQGFLVLCVLAFGLGAVHALTPGHGKTLVAAYLVGERGTMWHACLLGVTTTLTHTGAVLILAAVFAYAHLPLSRELETTLGLVMGLLIAGLGAWLLLQRLAGRADHIHLGGHSHHHAHGPHDHGHHHHPHSHNVAPRSTTWVGLVLLGIQGGLVPCWDAVVMLLFAIGANLLHLALPLLLAFSAGLATVLVVLGIVVVQAKGFAGSRWGESRLFRALPYLSAAAITVIGLGLCYQSVHH